MNVNKEVVNRLSGEVSPYLLQHAANPVDWYPWGEEAFERARSEDRPIFLSIGYSTCHWCHVMAKESFEDPDVAALMNETFVNVKVDREERPDIDSVYMQVCQMMTGQGGWPLTIVMTPDGEPFFAATYIPKVARFGMVGMVDLVPKLKEVWDDQRREVVETAANVAEEARRASTIGPGGSVGPEVLDLAYQQFVGRFDGVHGGFGPPPKFPSPHDIMFLLGHWHSTGEENALRMATLTLDRMRRGGMYDHVGGGFHRYSTDERWLVPHFEKMLYDQALLAMAYTDAYLATGNEEYASTARDVLDYVVRDMSSPMGGFHSAEDADSEGEEGKFYLWTSTELNEVLDPEDADLLRAKLNVIEQGNFRDPEGRKGLNILHLDPGSPVEDGGRTCDVLDRLRAVREGRTRPSLDDKVLTDWNGLMIAALAKGSRAFSEPRYADAAENAVSFVRENLMSDDGRLLHRYRDGDSSVPGQLDDHAFLVWGLIELYAARFDPEHLSMAVDVSGTMHEHFSNEGGAFFTSPDDGEDLLFRKVEFYDGAVPSGNSVALHNLVRLSRLTGDTDLMDRASRLARAVPNRATHMPSGHSHLTAGLASAFKESAEVVIVGDPEGDAVPFIDALDRGFLPSVTVLLKVDGLEELSEFVGPYERLDGKAAAYICRAGACEMPTTDPDDMMERLKSGDRDVGRGV